MDRQRYRLRQIQTDRDREKTETDLDHLPALHDWQGRLLSWPYDPPAPLHNPSIVHRHAVPAPETRKIMHNINILAEI